MPELSAIATHRHVKVWDLPVRLVHWSLVLLVIVLYVTAKVMDSAIDQHAVAGYTVLALVLFRIVWGFCGGTHARFGDFLRGPAATLRYARTLLRRDHDHPLGHNPLGGWMVVVLLAALATQAMLGLFSNDDILFDGPLRHLVTKETSDWMTALHAQFVPFLLGLIALHIAAVVFHTLYKGEKLAPAMITGHKRLSPEQPAEEVHGGSPLLAAILLAACAGAVYFVIS